MMWKKILWIFLVLGIAGCETTGVKTTDNPNTEERSRVPEKEEPLARPIVQQQEEIRAAMPAPTDTDSVLLYISGLLDQNDYEEALVSFEKLDSENIEIRLLKASTLISAGKIADARSIVEEIIKNDPAHIPALLILSSVEEAQNRNREQRAVLDKILALEPDNVTALVSMGNLMIRSSASRQAGPYFDRALAVEPGNGEALLGRAWVYRNAREPKNAETMLNKAIELYPDWARAFHERGRLYKANGFNQAALVDLDKALELDPDNYFIACDRADALKNLNRKNDALAEYERAIAIDPGYFLAYVFSSTLKDDLGDLDGAFNDYKKLTSLNPDYYFGFEGLGMHLMRRREWLAAKDAFVAAFRQAGRMSGAAQANSDESIYALLAAVSALKGGSRQDARPFLDEALRRVVRDSLEYRMLRLYRDWAGDVDITNRIDKEKNHFIKARMLFYFAWYYDIRGNTNLANKFFLQVRDLDAKNILEWRLNEWTLENRGFALK